jgi:hypothetical protein
LLAQLQLDLQPRMARLELRQRRADPEPAEAEGGRDADLPGRLGVAFAQVGLERLEGLHQAGRAFAQGFAFGRRDHAPGAALEQLESQAPLERGQPFGDDGRDHAGGRRRGGEAAVLPDAEQQLEVGAVQCGR